MFSLEAFRRGVDRGRALIGEEHCYSLMIHGIAEVMNEAGRKVAPMDLAGRWHDPLSSARDCHLDDPSEMLRWMGGGGLYGFERLVREDRVDFDDRWSPIDRLWDRMRWFGDEAAVEREAQALFDFEYKEKWPEKRRGTRHYKDTWERVRSQAISIKRAERIAEARRAVAEAERRSSSKEYDGDWFSRMQNARRAAGGWLVRADDLEALGIESEWIPKLRALAAEAFAKADMAEERVRDGIARAKAEIEAEEAKLSKAKEAA